MSDSEQAKDKETYYNVRDKNNRRYNHASIYSNLCAQHRSTPSKCKKPNEHEQKQHPPHSDRDS